MDRDAALRTLGVDDATPQDEVRKRYLALIREHHPDVATGATRIDAALITEAYRVVVAGAAAPLADADRPAADHRSVDVAAAGDTIVVALPPDEAFFAMHEIASDVGAVTYVDPDAGLLEIHLVLSDASRWSLVCSVQGRATGMTDVFCTLASLDPAGTAGEPPVAELVEELSSLLAGSLNC